MKNILLALGLLASTNIFAQPAPQTRDYASHVTIARDKWGVPHIFGDKDEDVAYGLAWANAEDDFKTMQETFLPVKEMMGRATGKDGAAMDFLNHLLGGDRFVEEHYYKDLSPDFIRYIEGYAAGINAYALAHPKEVRVKGAFPITGKDVIKGYFLTLALVSYAHGPIKDILGGRFDTIPSVVGSNGFAFSPVKTDNGHTMLCANPHVSLQGFLSWYEVQLHSEEGLDILGATFQGASSVFVGTNENLGWTHTWNLLDLVDTYELKMNPRHKLQYQFDGEWKTLEKRPIWLKVRLGKIVIPVKKTTYWSVYGPTLKSKKGKFYSIRYPANMDIRTPEQWYRMDKAKNFDEFHQALEMNAIPRFNIIYADKEGHLFYADNGKIPIRDTTKGYNWKGIVPGNTSNTLWTKYYTIDDMPQVRNPHCGYIYNMNNTPYDATCEAEDVPFGSFPTVMNFRTGNGNRSERFKQLIKGMDKVSFDEMKSIKFDSQFPDTSRFLSSIKLIYQLDTAKYPNLKEAISLMQHWDKKATPDAHGAAIWELAITYIFNKHDYDDHEFLTGIPLDEPELIEAIQHAQDHLLKYFGKVDVLLGDFQRLRRGDYDMPLPGFPDVLAANYSKPAPDGRYVGYVGDSYVLFAEYDKNGPVRIETLSPYGSSAKPSSPHYADQMPLFVKHQTKTMSMDKDEVLKTAERVYHPGQ